jgi:LemA protein
MQPRQWLEGRPGVAAADVDTIIERAARLQEAAHGPRELTRGEVADIAREVDVDERFVDAAIAELRREREAAARDADQRRRLWVRAGAAVAGLAAVTVLAGLAGRSRVQAASDRAHVVATQLDGVIERQATLVPQLLTLAGGDATALEPARRRVREAADVRRRLAASAELGDALASALARLPAAADPSAAQQRLSLQYELVGTQNRIAVERRRYDTAVAEWIAAASRFPGSISVALGLAPRP